MLPLEMQRKPPTPLEPKPEPTNKKAESYHEEKHRGTEGGWDISDDEGEDPNWLTDDVPEDEEEVYNHGSIRFPLQDENGEPTPVVKEYVNKATMVRTGFECFDFVDTEKIDETADAFHVYRSSRPIPRTLVFDCFAEFGKHIVDFVDDHTAFVVYENLTQDHETVKRKVTERLEADASGDGDGVVVETMAEYSLRQKRAT